jgi:Asp-tRNA(Asn)/Glu-tRNA(Gln) amidotransferase A subunit family amidase
MKQVPLNQQNRPQFTGSTSFLQHNHTERQEQEFLKRMEQAIKRLEAAGEAVLPRTVGMMIRLPSQRLDEYPLVKARFQHMLAEYQRTQEWQRQRREEEFAERLQRAISTCKAQGKVITPTPC